MPRLRQRACLEHGLRLDINLMVRQGVIRPGAARGAHELRWTWTATGEIVAKAVINSNLSGPEVGWLRIRLGDVDQWITLRGQLRPFGGRQWYFECPKTHRRCSVMWRPPGATRFYSRHAWRGQVAYASQFESSTDRAHRGQARIKARLIGDHDPALWDLPPKPKWMRWSTYDRLEERFDHYEWILDDHLMGLVARLMALDAKRG
ncbi:MAG: hypothetical protein AB7U75_22390 [Hyphomicrobiaceae bacterium]